jgi:hypothetical protein
MDVAMLAYIDADARTRRSMLRTARATYKAFRAERYGFQSAAALLTAPTAQAKLAKSAVPTFGLSLVPARTLLSFSGAMNLCPAATAGCEAACLNTAGKGRLSTVQLARQARADFLFRDPESFGIILASELVKHATAKGSIRVRLNVISDLRWELIIPRAMRRLARMGARFYDYTKFAPRMRRPIDGVYSLTYSASERHSDADLVALLGAGHNVAIVFGASKGIVKGLARDGATWMGFPIVDGLSTDDRTQDPSGVVVGLAALGDGIGDASGFVRTLSGVASLSEVA